MGAVSLEDPKQFMISWTTYNNQCDPGAADKFADGFAKELTDVDAATSGFWRRIAKFGTGYNLPGILRKVSAERFRELKALLEEPPHRASLNDLQPSPWQARFELLQKDGRFYEIDLSLFEDLPPRYYFDGSIKLVRYNLGTLTLLEMADKKELLPVLRGLIGSFQLLRFVGLASCLACFDPFHQDGQVRRCKVKRRPYKSGLWHGSGTAAGTKHCTMRSSKPRCLCQAARAD